MAETKEQFIKQVKSVSSELGEVLQARKFEEARSSKMNAEEI